MSTIILQGITADELLYKIRKTVAEAIDARTPDNPETSKKYLTRAEAAERLNISLPTLNEYTKRGLIPGRRCGRRVLYLETELEEAVKKMRTK
ncbi:MAG: helix-turn-helix domain-containing protein [Bacteroidales bacterium]|nr:helix-turn-helix domain-containing protein [Bacteroidales bacterium]